MFGNGVVNEELEKVRALVSYDFPVYNSLVSADAFVFFVQVFDDLDRRFESLRIRLRDIGYLPMIKKEKGEYMIYVMRMRKKGSRGVKINLIMLILTIITTGIAGTMLWSSYVNASRLFTAKNVIYGLIYFSAPLLLILGSHELGHYMVSKKHNVDATLPFFIPFPPPLGTMGAFISMKEPIPDRKALLDIGIAGPITGFLVAIPVALLGIHLSNIYARPVPPNIGEAHVYLVRMPLMYSILTHFLPLRQDVMIHPTMFAAWAGFIVTAINLMPIGQLDGGHVARAILRAKAKYLSYACIGVLIALSVYYNYIGWFIFAVLVMFLGLRHPPPLNDISELDKKRFAAGALGLSLIFLCFVPVPISVIESVHDYRVIINGKEAYSLELRSGDFANITIENTGNTRLVLVVQFEKNPALISQNITLWARCDNASCSVAGGDITVALDGGGRCTLTVYGALNGSSGSDKVSAYLLLRDADNIIEDRCVKITIRG